MSGKWTASYRLQLHAGFPLGAAQQVLPYLADLGISHVYLSPCLQAAPGSQHGYDVTDPSHISEDLGGEQAWERFVEGARRSSLGILIDIVPNHMSATHNNPWWEHVLAHGPFSEYASFFDIKLPLHQGFRVHICVLARAYGEALQAGELKLEIKDGFPRLAHYDNSWPLGPASWGELLSASGSAPCDPCFAELEALLEIRSADEEQRQRYERLAKRAGELLSGARADGR